MIPCGGSGGMCTTEIFENVDCEIKALSLHFRHLKHLAVRLHPCQPSACIQTPTTTTREHPQEGLRGLQPPLQKVENTRNAVVVAQQLLPPAIIHPPPPPAPLPLHKNLDLPLQLSCLLLHV